MIINILEKPYLIATDFRYYSPFVCVARLSFAGYTQPTRYDSSYDMTTPELNIDPVNLTNIYIDNIKYDLESSVAECQANEESFYMDVTNQDLYIHYNHSKRPTSSTFNSQQSVGYCSDKVFYDDNDFCYEPLVISSTSVTVTGDRNNKISFPKQNIQLDNSSSDLDSFFNDAIPGSDVKIKYISTTDLEAGEKGLTDIYAGFTTGDSFTTNKYSIESSDKRKQLNIKIPNTYHSIGSGLKGDGDLIPEGYGLLSYIPAIPIDPSSTTPTYKYLTDGSTTPTAAQYATDSDNWITDTLSSTTPTDAEYIMSTAFTADDPPDGRLTIEGRTEVNPADIIVDMFERYLEIPFTNEYFNVTQWTEEKAYLDDVYLYMDQEKPFFDWVQELQTSSTYDFQLLTDPTGKWTIKIADVERATSMVIESICNINMERPVNRSFDEYASSVTVLYNKDHSSETYSRVTNSDYEEDALEKYRLAKNIEVYSNLSTLTAATTKAARVAKEYSEARPTIEFTLNELTPIQIYDIIEIDNAFYEGLTKTREYIGQRKVMVNKITYDFNNESTKLTGLDITDI